MLLSLGDGLDDVIVESPQCHGVVLGASEWLNGCRMRGPYERVERGEWRGEGGPCQKEVGKKEGINPSCAFVASIRLQAIGNSPIFA